MDNVLSLQRLQVAASDNDQLTGSAGSLGCDKPV
jgi:hypothetical protein